MKILLTGGAGYIGSHVAKQLLETTEYELTIVDNLSTGSQATLTTLKKIRPYHFVELDLKNQMALEKLFQNSSFDLVFHFAAKISVAESVTEPLLYYKNNTFNTATLLETAMNNGVNKFIFSSTAAVYSEPKEGYQQGVDETSSLCPNNPYGRSKQMSEEIIKDLAATNEAFCYVIFRYFNVAGSDIYYDGQTLKPRIGNASSGATQLIKVAAECATGKREKVFVYGDDYDTPDGTGVRDYIHVEDLARAHLQAIEYLQTHKNEVFNVGYSHGYSVREVLETMQKISGQSFPVVYTQRRKGDLGALIANSTKIQKMMGWKPKYDDLRLICESAYLWELKQS